MQLVQSKLQFENYIVNRLSYASVPEFVPKEGEVYNLNPDFSRRIENVEDNKYSLTLDMSLGTNNERFPFVLEVSITGFFTTNNVEDPIKALKTNATAILFPYVRALLTMLSNLASIPPVVLPPINFAEMANASEEQTEQEKKS